MRFSTTKIESRQYKIEVEETTPRWESMTQAGGSNYRILLFKRKKKEGEEVIFKGGHFDDDTLFHVRLKDREGENGERILFIEEIQSDWATKYNSQDNRDFEERVSNATNRVNDALDEIRNYYLEGKNRAKHLAQLKTYLNDLKAKQEE